MRIFLFLLPFYLLVSCTSSDNSGNNGGGDEQVETKDSCTLPWGGLLDHGQQVRAFKDAQVEKPAQCISEQRTCNDGSLSGVFVNKECVEKEPTQNPNELPPIQVDGYGKKWGKCKLLGEQSQWIPDTWHGEAPSCPEGTVLGGSCDNNVYQSCKLPDGSKLICNKQRQYNCYGWIYEMKAGQVVKPLANVDVDIWWFVGCMAGSCKPVAGPVKTNENGYFELKTGALLDTLRIHSPTGYYAHCKDGKPIAGGGTNLYQGGLEEPLTGGFWQYKITPESCKLGVPGVEGQSLAKSRGENEELPKLDKIMQEIAERCVTDKNGVTSCK